MSLIINTYLYIQLSTEMERESRRERVRARERERERDRESQRDKERESERGESRPPTEIPLLATGPVYRHHLPPSRTLYLVIISSPPTPQVWEPL